MRKSKKIITLLLAVILALSLTACKAGVPSYDLEIDPATGNGTANFTIRVPKNDVPEVGNNFDKVGEAGYIKSPEALLKLFKKAVPAGFTVTMVDEPKLVVNDNDNEVDQGNFAFVLSFAFQGIDDYNNKIMKLVGQSAWDGANASAKEAAAVNGSTFAEIRQASLVYEPKGDKQTATFTEDLRILDVISYWAYQVLTTDKSGVWNDIFKDTYPDYPVNFGNTINLDLSKYSIKFGGDAQEYRHSSDVVTMKATVDAVKEVDQTVKDTTVKDTTVKDTTVKDTTVKDTNVKDTGNANEVTKSESHTSLPATGESLSVVPMIVIIAAVLLVGLIFSHRKLKKEE